VVGIQLNAIPAGVSVGVPVGVPVSVSVGVPAGVQAPTCQDGMPPPTQSPETKTLGCQVQAGWVQLIRYSQVTINHPTCVTNSTNILTKPGCELAVH
jgi:hypothetical protein